MNTNTLVADKIFSIISKYSKNYDYIIEYGSNSRIVIRKDMVVGYDHNKQFLCYYADSKTDNIPLGIILISSITAIKRRER